MLDALPKVEELLATRREKDGELEATVGRMGSRFTIDELYQTFHSHKGISHRPFEQFMKLVLTRRLAKLIEENKLV
jgi:hypothetical protein